MPIFIHHLQQYFFTIFNNFSFSHFGVKPTKEDASTSTGLPKINQMSSSSVPKPIITVTEFTPGNTPDKVRLIKDRNYQARNNLDKTIERGVE